MDLESPFLKTALVKGATGAIEEREVTKVKIVGDKIELITTKGGVALFPATDVSAVLPKFPNTGVVYQLKDVDEAIRMLESLPAELKQRPEASTETLQKWKDLRKPAEEADAKRREEERKAQEETLKQEEAKINEWMKDVADFQKPRSEIDLAAIREQGQKFLDLKVGDKRKVREGLALLAQVVGKEKGGPLPDLVKLNEIQPKLVADDLLVWVVVGVLAISFFGLLIGLSFTSSGLTRIREGAILGGIVFGGLGVSILAGLAAIWWPVSGEGKPIGLTVSPEMERVMTFAKNSVKPVYFLPSMEFRVPSHDFAIGILASLPPSEEATGIFKGRLKVGKLWITKDRYIWSQPVTALGIPIPVSFVFEGKIPTAGSWHEVASDRVSLGKVVIPDPLGSAFVESMKAILQGGLSAGGFSGIKAKSGGGEDLILSTTSSGTKPVLTVNASSSYRKEISAEDLANIFVDNKGAEFNGKFVLIDGVVDKINSGSEFSGIANAGVGDPLNKDKAPQKIKDDQFDVFYLHGIDSYGYRKDPLYIKVIIKSPDVFVMDKYGDIYKGPNANIVKEKALIKKGYRVKFLKEGRVQSDQIKNNEIEVYGVEIDGVGDIQCFDPSAPPPK
jgi:Skp family chaperone for outer membrane proteins